MENLNQYRICKGATNLAVDGHPQDDPGRVIIHWDNLQTESWGDEMKIHVHTLVGRVWSNACILHYLQ